MALSGSQKTRIAIGGGGLAYLGFIAKSPYTPPASLENIIKFNLFIDQKRDFNLFIDQKKEFELEF